MSSDHNGSADRLREAGTHRLKEQAEAPDLKQPINTLVNHFEPCNQ